MDAKGAFVRKGKARRISTRKASGRPGREKGSRYRSSIFRADGSIRTPPRDGRPKKSGTSAASSAVGESSRRRSVETERGGFASQRWGAPDQISTRAPSKSASSRG